jgi:bacterial/archaeal transporter family-2 protein
MLFGLITIFIGLLAAIQSRINGQFSKDVHNGLAAALISFLTGWLLIFILMAFLPKERAGLKTIFHAMRHRALRRWEVTGGAIGGFFVATQSISVPLIGVGLFTIITVAGQTVASLYVDKYGLSPRGKQHITPSRVVAASLTLVAICIAVYPDLKHSSLRFLPLVFSLIVGCLASLQQALNGRINEIAKSPLATAWMNFLMGTVVISIALIVNLSTGGSVGALPSNPFIYLGGSIGVIFIALSAHIIRHMGVLNFILFSVTGQLLGAVALDWLVPAYKGALTINLVVGVLLTIGSIAFARYFGGREVRRA